MNSCKRCSQGSAAAVCTKPSSCTVAGNHCPTCLHEYILCAGTGLPESLVAAHEDRHAVGHAHHVHSQLNSGALEHVSHSKTPK